MEKLTVEKAFLSLKELVVKGVPFQGSLVEIDKKKMANKHLTIFDGVDITTNPSDLQKISSNYAVALQLVWTGLSGSASFNLGVSMNNINFDEFPFIDPTDGSRVTSIPITGESGSLTIEIDSIISDYAKFNIDGSAASAGTIDGDYSQIDNQDTY